MKLLSINMKSYSLDIKSSKIINDVSIENINLDATLDS